MRKGEFVSLFPGSCISLTLIYFKTKKMKKEVLIGVCLTKIIIIFLLPMKNCLLLSVILIKVVRVCMCFMEHVY